MLHSLVRIILFLLISTSLIAQDSLEEKYHFLKWFPDHGLSELSVNNYALIDRLKTEENSYQVRGDRWFIFTDPAWKKLLDEHGQIFAQTDYRKILLTRAERKAWRSDIKNLKKAKTAEEKKKAGEKLSELVLEQNGLAYILVVEDSKTLFDQLQKKGLLKLSGGSHLDVPFYLPSDKAFRFEMSFCFADDQTILLSNKEEVLAYMLDSGNGNIASILEGEKFKSVSEYHDYLGDERWWMEFLLLRHMIRYDEMVSKGETNPRLEDAHTKFMEEELHFYAGSTTLTEAGSLLREIYLFAPKAEDYRNSVLDNIGEKIPGLLKWNSYIEAAKNHISFHRDGNLIVKTTKMDAAYTKLIEAGWHEKRDWKQKKKAK